MKLLPALLMVGACSAFVGCSNTMRPAKYTRLPDIDEQCDILALKRQTRSGGIFGSRQPRVTNYKQKKFSVRTLRVVPVIHLDEQQTEISDRYPENNEIGDGGTTVVAPVLKDDILPSTPVADNKRVFVKRARFADAETTVVVPITAATKLNAKSVYGDKQSSWWFFGVSSASAAVAMAGIGAFRKRARRISQWASRNSQATRTIITATHLATGIGALYAGRSLADAGMIASEMSTYAAAAILTGAAALYPMKKVTDGLFNGSFVRRKMHDAVLAASSVCLIFNLGQSVELPGYSPVAVEAVEGVHNPGSDQYSVAVDNALPTLVGNPMQTEPVQKAKPIHEWPMGGKIFVTLVLLGLLTFATMGVAVLACSLSCNGHGFLAVVVGFGGTGTLLAMFIGLMRRIFSHDKFLEKQKKRRERRAARRATGGVTDLGTEKVVAA